MISHHHRTVFVHIPKCGGQSIEAAFLADLGLKWSTRAPLLLRPNDQPLLGPPRLAHLTARDYVEHRWLPGEMFEDYFTFALVRSPFARALSHYNYHFTQHGLAPSDWVEKVLVREFERAPRYARPGHGYPGEYHFLRPQADFLTDADGAVMVERTYRLEALGEALPEIHARAGLSAEVGHANSSEKRAGFADFSAGDLDTIRTLYAADFALLGYPEDP